MPKKRVREYKERTQPQARRKLEKARDYRVRKKHHREREIEKRRLEEKAAFRNPDEFYFGMVRSKMVGGTSRLSRKGSQHSHKEILEMRDQDDGYLAAKLTSERKSGLQGTAAVGSVKRTHIIYVDSDEEEDFDASEYFNTPKELLNTAIRPTYEMLEEGFVVADVDEKTKKKMKKKNAARYHELSQRMDRLDKLEDAVESAFMKKRLLTDGAVHKSIDPETNKPVYKWKRVRKT